MWYKHNGSKLWNNATLKKIHGSGKYDSRWNCPATGKNLWILSHVGKMKHINKQETGQHSLKIEGNHLGKGAKMEKGETVNEGIREST